MGNVDVVFHGVTDKLMKLVDVSYVPGLGFGLYLLLEVQSTYALVCDTCNWERTTF